MAPVDALDCEESCKFATAGVNIAIPDQVSSYDNLINVSIVSLYTIVTTSSNQISLALYIKVLAVHLFCYVLVYTIISIQRHIGD